MTQTKITTSGITDTNITVDKLSNTLDLSSKTVTLPASALSYPTFTSITPSTTTNDATSFVIVGTNFGASGIPTVEFQNLTGGIVTSTSVVRDSTTQLTVVATLPVDGTYYIRIELNTGLAVRSTSASLTISDAPAWTTGSGTLGTIAGDFSGAVATVAATGDTVTYSEVNGTGLTGAGNANCSLNTSTGAITTTDFGGSSTAATTYNFTIRATDAQGQTSDRAFSLTSSYTYTINALVVAGGGAGSNGNSGGGGGGGMRTTNWTSGASVVYTIVIGQGGTKGTGGLGTDGSNSSLAGTGVPSTPFTSAGGGKGGRDTTGGGNGGSGGGGGYQSSGGSGNTPSTSPSQGANGGAGTVTAPGYPGGGGGGGGASGVTGQNAPSGTVSGNGGNGTQSSITGTAVYYAGGGGGAIESSYTFGTGGSGGGGDGGNYNTSAQSGTDGLGGGGGSAYAGNGSGSGGVGGDGGDGVVILSVPTANYSGTTTGSPTVTTSGSNKIIKFLANGTYTS